MTVAFEKPNFENAIMEQMGRLLEEVEYLHSTGMSWLESVVQYCEDMNIEVEEVVQILPPSVVQKIKEEGILARTVKGEVVQPLWS